MPGLVVRVDGARPVGPPAGRRCYLSLILEDGVAFLLERQSEDWLWHDFLTLGGEASDWPTGLIGAELAAAGGERAALERAAACLLSRQQADGGWGYHAGVPTDADSTACVALFLAAMGCKSVGVERAISCLARHQDVETGGIATYCEPGPIRRFMGLGVGADLDGWCSSHVEVTATAGRAIAVVADANGEGDAGAAWRYVRALQRPEGSWDSYWWASRHYPTLQAVALARHLGDEEAVARAGTWALRSQQDDGGWSAPGARISAFATALSLSILLCAGGAGAAVDRATKCLLALQAADGGWPSHPIMRIPPPDLIEPDSRALWRGDALGTGVVIRDQHRLFTTALCVGALARAADTA